MRGRCELQASNWVVGSSNGRRDLGGREKRKSNAQIRNPDTTQVQEPRLKRKRKVADGRGNDEGDAVQGRLD